ncbi:MAG TPA: hypothetical protein VFG68_00510 [Fimbriiglobus sp.]|nr:hypothetical protein [Fimbriiglobus sp.]
MARSCPVALVCAVLLLPAARAADPGPIDRTLAVQTAMAEAKNLLIASKSAEAVAALEKQLPNADGSRAFLDLLRSAYAAEVKRLQLAGADSKQVADVRTKLSLIGGAAPAPVVAASEPAPKPAAEPNKALEALRQAKDLFHQAQSEPGKYGPAAKLFAAAFLGKVRLSHEQMAAWAYCRVRVAADQLKRKTDPASAAEVAAEVEEALKLAPDNAGLQKVGAELIARARRAAGGARSAAPAADGWEVVETASFRVRHKGHRVQAEALARTAEAARGAIFARWSGPPGGAWGPKCEVVLHPTAADFAAATRQPAGATGRATVKLDGGRAVERRIDLRADDATAAVDALPREMTYVVLADLFPSAAPPRWAEAGMAVLACSPAEVERYRRTLARCYRDGELFPIEALFELKAPPAERVTGFAVESASLVAYLVKAKGERAFTAFLRDAQRYGLASALKRQYGVSDAKQLGDAWMQSELSVARAQAP